MNTESKSNTAMSRKPSWNSFEGLTPEQKKAKAKKGVICALVAFVLMNVIAFVL